MSETISAMLLRHLKAMKAEEPIPTPAGCSSPDLFTYRSADWSVHLDDRTHFLDEDYCKRLEERCPGFFKLPVDQEFIPDDWWDKPEAALVAQAMRARQAAVPLALDLKNALANPTSDILKVLRDVHRKISEII